MSQVNRFDARAKLLSAAASWMASNFHFEQANPGPNDDAEMEYKDEHLLHAAREYVSAHNIYSYKVGDKITFDIYDQVTGQFHNRYEIKDIAADGTLLLEVINE